LRTREEGTPSTVHRGRSEEEIWIGDSSASIRKQKHKNSRENFLKREAISPPVVNKRSLGRIDLDNDTYKTEKDFESVIPHIG